MLILYIRSVTFSSVGLMALIVALMYKSITNIAHCQFQSIRIVVSTLQYKMNVKNGLLAISNKNVPFSALFMHESQDF